MRPRSFHHRSASLRRIDLARSFLALGLVVIAILTTSRWGFRIISNSSTGLDLTDEGYYLSAVEFPGLIPHAPTDYGSYLRNIWLLVGQDVQYFRIAGFLMLALSSFLFAALIFQGKSFSSKLLKWTCVALSAGIVLAGSCYQYVLWIVTPNYNLLTLVILLPLAGLLIQLLVGTETAVSLGKRRVVIVEHLFFGAGLVLLFAVRFSAAAVALLIYLLILAFTTERGDRRQSGFSGLFGAVIGFVFHLALVRRWPWTSASLWIKSHDLSNLRNDHPASVIWELDFFRSDVKPWLPWGVALIALVASVRLFVRSLAIRRGLSLSIAVITATTLWPSRPQGGDHAAELGVGWWWLRLFFYFFLAIFLDSERISRRDLIAPMLLLLGFAGAAGSANGVYRQMIFMVGLLVAGVFAQTVSSYFQSVRNGMLLAPSIVAISMALVVVFSSADGAVQSPYRLQGSLQSNQSKIDLDRHGVLSVHPNTAEFIRWIQRIKSDIPPTVECVVNLEGGTPVIPVILGIRPAGSNWELGGYPGSDEAERSGLALDSCWRDAPFILITSPNSFRAIKVPSEVQTRCTNLPLAERDMTMSYPARFVITLCND